MGSAIDALYRRVLKPILFRVEAETAHQLALAFLSAMPPLPIAPDPPELGQTLWKLPFANPVGLAAGMDKDARAVDAWQVMGFGFAELGTITPRPQPGNPAPRMWRIPEHRALINRLGFPSEGMEAVAVRLRRLRSRGVRLRLGLNFGPNRDTPPERVVDDYRALMKRLAPMADFVVINLSSPNTPGLRGWQAPDQMRRLFGALLAPSPGVDARADASSQPPILLKIAPDLDASQIASICEVAAELHLDGIVATNTTLARDAVDVRSTLEGGLSGQPLREPARAVIREIYQRTRGALPIIGVGGVASAADAWEHIRAGASLIELYTGLVYAGPGLAGAIKAGLVELLRRERLDSIAQAVGTAA